MRWTAFAAVLLSGVAAAQEGVSFGSRYNSVFNSTDTPTAIIPTRDEGFVVIGSTVDPGQTERNWMVARFNSRGLLKFSRPISFNVEANQTEVANDVVLDAQGNFWVTGQSFVNTNTGTVWGVAKLSPRLELIKTVTFDNKTGPKVGEGKRVRLRPGGGVVVGGDLNSGLQLRGQAIALDADGNVDWQYRVTTPGYTTTRLRDIEVDPASGQTVIVAQGEKINGDADVILVRLDTDGNPIWTRIYDIPAETGETAPRRQDATDLVLDRSSSAVVYGTTPERGGTATMLIKISRSGGQTFWKLNRSTRGASTLPLKLAVDRSNNIIGVSTTVETLPDGSSHPLLRFGKWSPSGLLELTNEYDDGGVNTSASIFTGPDGSVVVAANARPGDPFGTDRPTVFQLSGNLAVRDVVSSTVPGAPTSSVVSAALTSDGHVVTASATPGGDVGLISFGDQPVDREYVCPVNTRISFGSGQGVLTGEPRGSVALLVAAPVRGIIDFRPNGWWSYTPPRNFTGTVTFTYTFTRTDSTGTVDYASGFRTVTIKVQ